MNKNHRQSNCNLFHISGVGVDVVMDVRLDVRSEVGEDVRSKFGSYVKPKRQDIYLVLRNHRAVLLTHLY